MKVVVLYNEASEDSAIDARDVLIQRDAVTAALRRLGHQTHCLGCTLDLAAIKSRLVDLQPDVVFNLVESLGGTDRLMTLATMLLDAMGLPYTGSRTESILATNNKVAAKQRLLEAGLPTPEWLDAGGQAATNQPPSPAPHHVILKSVWEHASFALGDDAVFLANRDAHWLQQRIRRREAMTGRQYFAEQYIEGREFNLSLLADPNGHYESTEKTAGVAEASPNGAPQVLPPAEIDFSAFAPEMPRIVGFRAKWETGSFEYKNTPRRYVFGEPDAALLDQLSQIARQCWKLFELRGYARVDFRVGRDGRPWILEVNANPCLSPDAGFAAALQEAHLEMELAVQRILDDARGVET